MGGVPKKYHLFLNCPPSFSSFPPEPRFNTSPSLSRLYILSIYISIPPFILPPPSLSFSSFLQIFACLLHEKQGNFSGLHVSSFQGRGPGKGNVKFRMFWERDTERGQNYHCSKDGYAQSGFHPKVVYTVVGSSQFRGSTALLRCIL